MCEGDFEVAIELALASAPEDPAEAARREAFQEELLKYQTTEAELEETGREEEARSERIDESAITTGADKVRTLAWAGVAEELRRLEVDVERTFPDAWKFVRPGFDQVP